jgi:hypothetical protein
MNQCSPCGEDFSSITNFDAHRVGKHMPLARRCLSVAELVALGWEKNSRGAWHDPAKTEDVRERLSARAV